MIYEMEKMQLKPKMHENKLKCLQHVKPTSLTNIQNTC
uniref:Uncharacterized protein n=1 Tax=Rhizophora mucronata TaxID=61149 RepID=A0A2P2QUT5_RHIMU